MHAQVKGLHTVPTKLLMRYLLRATFGLMHAGDAVLTGQAKGVAPGLGWGTCLPGA